MRSLIGQQIAFQTRTKDTLLKGELSVFWRGYEQRMAFIFHFHIVETGILMASLTGAEAFWQSHFSFVCH